MTTTPEDNDVPTRPAPGRDDPTDLLHTPRPRVVVVADRRWMEPYHALEEGEPGARLAAARGHAGALALWLRALALYRAAFADPVDAGTAESVEAAGPSALRADLLRIAGGASKPALDALAAGYYPAAFGLIRGLLEAWRRAAFVRLRPDAAMPWFAPPPTSAAVAGDDPGTVRRQPIPFPVIAAGFEGAPAEDRELLALVNAGVAQFHGGAHPSAEAMLRRWAGREVGGAFGPTYDRRLCAFGLNWGLFAHLALLREVDRLRPQNRAWVRDQDELASGYETWRLAYDREFTGDASGEAGGS